MSGASEQQYYDDLRASTQQHVDAANFWRGESGRHEVAREQLLITSAAEKAARDRQVSDALVSINKGIIGAGTKRTQLGIFGGTLQYQAGNVAGSEDFAAVTRDAGADGLAYLHLETGVEKNGEAGVMCLYMIRGYNYGSNLINNEQASAYLFYTGVHQQKSTDNGMAPFFYVGSNNRFYLRLKIISQYFNQILFDATSPSTSVEGLKFVGGRITATSIETI